MKDVWVNDIHLEFLDERAIARFFDELKSRDPDCILVGRDTGQAHTVCDYLIHMFQLIQELSGLPKKDVLAKLQRIGDEAGSYFKLLLPEA